MSLLTEKRELEEKLASLKNKIEEGDEVKTELSASLQAQLETTKWVSDKFAEVEKLRGEVRERVKTANAEIVRIRNEARKLGVYDESFDVRLNAEGKVVAAIKRNKNGEPEEAELEDDE